MQKSLTLRPVIAATILATAAHVFAPLPCATAETRPKIRSLGELAAQITLSRAAFEDSSGALTINNETLRETADGGCLTTVQQAAAELPVSQPPSPRELAARATLRQRWQARVTAQRRRVARAQAELEALDGKIDSVADQALDSGAKGNAAWARVDALRSRRPGAVRKLATEQQLLARIIRDARKDGAQPGWFR